MRIVIVTALAAALMWAGTPALPAQNPPRAVVVVAGNISIRDLVDPSLPGFSRLIEQASAGLMNVRTGRSSRDIETASPGGMEPGCVSLGAGAMAVGGAETRRASDAQGLVNGEIARELYLCRTGVDAGSAAMVHTEIARLQRANASAAYRATPGALGGALRQAGITTAVIGSSDVPGEIRREVTAVAMDENGLVDMGTVSSRSLNTTDPSAPYGVRANNDAIIAELDQVFSSPRLQNPDSKGCLVVIAFADTFRADSRAELYFEHRAAMARRQAVHQLEELTAEVLKRLDPDTDLFALVCPNSPRFSDVKGERLAPVIMRGPNCGKGVLTSPSTRVEGVVTISDFAPTILEFFGVDTAPGMVGRAMRTAARSDSASFLTALSLNAAAQSSRQAAMRGSSVAQSVVVAAITLALLLGAARAARIAAWVALVPIAMPPAMLCLPLVYSGGLIVSVVLLAVLTGAIVAACVLWLRQPVRSLAWLCGITAAAIALDLARGGALISSSIAGYNIAEGARYYGIGNELMGTLLGTTLVGVGLALSGRVVADRLKGIFAAAVFAGVFVLIGASGLGANAGGAMAAAPAMAAALLVRSDTRITAGWAALAAAAVVALAVGIFALDALRSASAQSHLGRTAGIVTGGGLWELLSILQRKIALNLLLVKNSLWSRLLALSLVSAAAIWARGRSSIGLTREQSAAAAGCCVGVVGAFAFNDSGVVAAATCAVVLWAMLAVIALERRGADA